MEDKKLVQRLKANQTPLTVCPLSNVKLRVFDQMSEHNLKELMAAGLMVTINSDDPSYFGGYLNENFEACASVLSLDKHDVAQLAKQSFNASFLDQETQKKHCDLIDRLLAVTN